MKISWARACARAYVHNQKNLWPKKFFFHQKPQKFFLTKKIFFHQKIIGPRKKLSKKKTSTVLKHWSHRNINRAGERHSLRALKHRPCRQDWPEGPASITDIARRKPMRTLPRLRRRPRQRRLATATSQPCPRHSDWPEHLARPKKGEQRCATATTVRWNHLSGKLEKNYDNIIFD